MFPESNLSCLAKSSWGYHIYLNFVVNQTKLNYRKLKCIDTSPRPEHKTVSNIGIIEIHMNWILMLENKD
jgi:hypothetical protein